jgi:hypothetical protein
MAAFEIAMGGTVVSVGGTRPRGGSVVDPDSFTARTGRALRYDAAEAALAAGRPLAVAAELAIQALVREEFEAAWDSFGAPEGGCLPTEWA